jgi:hypothetical protein
MKEQSLASKKREEKRNSPKTLELKKKVITFLENKNPEAIYAIKRDLACMTSMPFYKDRPKRIKLTLNKQELIVEFMKIFISHNDKKFIIKLIKLLSTNQNQTIRKVSPQIGNKSDIWEHVIPTKYIVDELILMIENEDISDLEKLLNIYRSAGQRGITKDQDLLLAEYKSSMPENWN